LFARGFSLVVAVLAPWMLAAATNERHPTVLTQLYRVSGRDSFRIGSRALRGDIAYAGRETLTITKDGGATRYVAKASYERIEGGEAREASATFVSTIFPNGRERDEETADPDFLTVLDQAFAVRLDAATLRDVRSLKEPAPFSFASSMTGATLRGTLFHVPDGRIAGHPVIGIGFDASGPIRGKIPEQAGIALKGTIRMSGRAYYTAETALLYGLDATLTIDGTLADESTHDPVHILYRRTIRAE
jgi:hypothetical protein